MSVTESKTDTPSAIAPRRGILKRLFLVAFGLVSYHSSSRATGASQRPNQSTAKRDQVPGPPIVRKPLSYVPSGYPQPTYIPSGYRLVATFTNRPDGFQGGEGEVVWWYSNPRPDNVISDNWIAVFVTPAPKAPFHGIEDHSGQPISFSIEGSGVVQAQYYDGEYKLSLEGDRLTRDGRYLAWDTRFNSLIFQFRGFQVGIRGLKFRGIGMDVLLDIARSLR